MGINLSTLAGKLAKTSVEFMGHTINITYDPTYLTQESMAKMQAGGDDAFIEFFTSLVKNWDVTKGNKKVPITANGLAGVPLLMLRAIYHGVMSQSDGDLEEGKASSAG